MAEKKEKQYVSDNARLMAEWDREKNEDFSPHTLTLGSGKKVWWKCANGHAWQASISNRSYHKSGCPYCRNKKTLQGYNDLATTHPELTAEWHPTLSKQLTPEMAATGSNNSVWWRCKSGHEYSFRLTFFILRGIILKYIVEV